jgi:hypothetical protein
MYFVFGMPVAYEVYSVDVWLNLKNFKFENINCSSVEDTAVPPNFNTSDNGQVGWNV